MRTQSNTGCNKKMVFFGNQNIWTIKLICLLPPRVTTKESHLNQQFIMERDSVMVGSKGQIGQVVDTDSDDHLTEVDLCIMRCVLLVT